MTAQILLNQASTLATILCRIVDLLTDRTGFQREWFEREIATENALSDADAVQTGIVHEFAGLTPPCDPSWVENGAANCERGDAVLAITHDVAKLFRCLPVRGIFSQRERAKQGGNGPTLHKSFSKRLRQGGARLFVRKRVTLLSFDLKHCIYQSALVLFLLLWGMNTGLFEVRAENLHEFAIGPQQPDPPGNPAVSKRVNIDHCNDKKSVQSALSYPDDFLCGNGALSLTGDWDNFGWPNYQLADHGRRFAKAAILRHIDWPIAICLNHQERRYAISAGNLFSDIFDIDRNFFGLPNFGNEGVGAN